MAEKLYEGMFLLDSGHYASDPEGMEQAVTGLLEKAGGTIVANRPWQDGRLAYEIEGRRKGLHYLALFKMPAENMTALTRQCSLNDKILRQMFIQQPPTLFEAMVAALSGEIVPQDDEPTPKRSSRDDDSDDGDDSDDSDD